MARKKIIPDEIREEIIARVDAFNQANVRSVEPTPFAQLLQKLGVRRTTADSPPKGSYIPRFKGGFLYLDRIGWNGRPSEICRLRWTGDMENWKFAIYRHSRDVYDPDEWMFPGSGHVDGTVEGAMRAGIEAYPQ